MKEKVIYKKVINECRECPNCRITAMIDIDGAPSENEEYAVCAVDGEEIEQAIWRWEKIEIPTWCPLKD